MSEEQTLILNHAEQTTVSGEILLAPEVLEIIIGIAASNVSGVASMQGNLTTNVNELLGRPVYQKGVHLTNTGSGLIADIYCFVEYGVVVPNVAMKIQEKVRQQVLFMTDISLKEVNVHIVGMVAQTDDVDSMNDGQEDA